MERPHCWSVLAFDLSLHWVPDVFIPFLVTQPDSAKVPIEHWQHCCATSITHISDKPEFSLSKALFNEIISRHFSFRNCLGWKWFRRSNESNYCDEFCRGGKMLKLWEYGNILANVLSNSWVIVTVQQSSCATFWSSQLYSIDVCP